MSNDILEYDVDEVVGNWKWRIIKAGFKNIKAFCEEYGIPSSQFSVWINGKSTPELKNVQKVEAILKNLEE